MAPKKAGPKTTVKSVARKAAAKKSIPVRARKRRSKPAALTYGVAPLIADEAALTDAVATLLVRDPKGIGHMLEIAGPPPLRRREPGFAGLATIIVSQQVSVASASAIFGRLAATLDPLDAPALVQASEATLRGCGLSGPKIRALQAIAAAMVDGTLDLAALETMPAAQAHAALCAVHGIGPWTADIFLLFCLGHPDAWPVGDIALQEAVRIALKLRKRPDPAKLTKIGERWRPHRGVVARLLWAYYRAVKARGGLALA